MTTNGSNALDQKAQDLIAQAMAMVTKLMELRTELQRANPSVPPLDREVDRETNGEPHRESYTTNRGEPTQTYQGRDPKHPAVDVKKSVTPDYIVCLECGERFKSIKRHLQSAHGLSTWQYMNKWNLPADYPFTAPNYSEERSSMAKKLGLGRKPNTPPPEAPPAEAPKRGRGKGGGRRAAAH